MAKRNDYQNGPSKEEIESAINLGGKSAEVLRNIICILADMSCPNAYGFEGPDTFMDCEECVICVSKKVKKDRDREI